VLLPSTVYACTVCFVTTRIRTLLIFTVTTTQHVMLTRIGRYLCRRRVRENSICSSFNNAHDHGHRKVWRGDERKARRLPGRLKKKERRCESSGSTISSSIYSLVLKWTPLHAYAHIKTKTANITSRAFLALRFFIQLTNYNKRNSLPIYHIPTT
jgi:hypothetical protein